MNTLNGYRVVVSASFVEIIGHWFHNPPPSRHRSRRLWKKLRYGRRRGNVSPIVSPAAFIAGGTMFLHPSVYAALKARS